MRSSVPHVTPSISTKVRAAFDAGARSRGDVYWRQGRVELCESGATEAYAVVRGTEPYAVLLRLSVAARYTELVAHCTCPFFEDRDEGCKHLWAVLRAIDGTQALSAAARWPVMTLIALDPDEDLDEIASLHELALSAGADGEHEDEDDDEDAEEEDDEDDDEDAEEEDDEPDRGVALTSPRVAAVTPARVLQRRASFEDWAFALREARRERGAAPIPAELDRRYRKEHAYRIDLPATLRDARGLAVSVRARVVGPSSPNAQWKPAELTAGSADEALGDADRRVVRALLGSVRRSRYDTYMTLGAAFHVANTDVWKRLLAPLGETGRCEVDVGGGVTAPLVVDRGGAFRVVLVVEETKRTTSVRGELRRGDEAIDIGALTAILGAGVAFEGARAVEIECEVPWSLVRALRTHGVLRAETTDEREELARALLETCGPDALAWTTPFTERPALPGGPHVRVRLTTDRRANAWRDAPLMAEVTFDYDGALVPFGAQGSRAVDLRGRRIVPRDLAAEQGALAELAAAGFQLVGRTGEAGTLTLPAKKLVAAIEALPEERYTIEADGLLFRRPSKFATSVTSGIDWFSLDVKVSFDEGEVELPEILAAIQRGERTVRLGKGGVGILPEAWLARLGRAMELSTGGRFSRTQIALLEAVLADDRQPIAWDGPLQVLRRQIDALTRPSALERFTAPRAFAGELRGYQSEGASWLRALEAAGFGGCLADDMGLGKTVQVLAHLAERSAKRRARAGAPSLVVAPRSVVHNWIEEARRFTPSLRVVELTKDTPLDGVDLAVTSYGVMREQIGRLSRVELDYLVLDEAHAIKNPDAATTKAALLLRARARLALTGTPVENRLGDLVSLFEFLNPGMLGPSLKKSAKRWSVDATGAAASLGRGLRPFLLRRTKAEVLAELPSRIEQTIPCALGKKQRAVYDEVKRYYQATLLARVRERGVASESMNVLEALLRLRQIACHPGLVERSNAHDESAKLSTLVDHLAPLVESGKKALVFSQFTSLLDIVERELDARGVTHVRLDGSTRDRKACVARFQDDARCSVFLISLKAGGVGLNLTAAEYVFLLDPWWNPAAEAQAIDRAHRMGQKRSVVAYRLLAKDTVEDRVAELQAKKRALVESVFDAGSGAVSLGKLSVNDVEALLA